LLAVAVLPFDNMSGDPEQAYFSDGITEDIIAELSRFRNLLVIARNSTFAFKGQAIDLREIGRTLGAQFIFEGSVRKAGNRVRVTAQLIDADSGNHVWSERFDRELDDIFAIQDEVATGIVGKVAGQVQLAGIDRVRRRTGSFATYDYYLQGMEHANRAAAEDIAPALELFQRAIAEDPNFAPAYAMLSVARINYALKLWADQVLAEENEWLEKAINTAHRATALDGNNARGHASLGAVISCESNSILPLIEAFGDQPQHALDLLELARKLCPIFPNWYFEPWGIALYGLRRYAEAAEVFERSSTKRPYVYRYIAASYAQLGEITNAKAAATESLRRQPEFNLRQWVASEPYKTEAGLRHMHEGLRKAGLPE
jgi:adenylate cyclase